MICDAGGQFLEMVGAIDLCDEGSDSHRRVVLNLNHSARQEMSLLVFDRSSDGPGLLTSSHGHQQKQSRHCSVPYPFFLHYIFLPDIRMRRTIFGAPCPIRGQRPTQKRTIRRLPEELFFAEGLLHGRKVPESVSEPPMRVRRRSTDFLMQTKPSLT